jgi:hypothetical protein
LRTSRDKCCRNETTLIPLRRHLTTSPNGIGLILGRGKAHPQPSAQEVDFNELVLDDSFEGPLGPYWRMVTALITKTNAGPKRSDPLTLFKMLVLKQPFNLIDEEPGFTR